MDNIYIISQCASSGTPGQEVLIQNAFFTFERNYCNLTSAIGTTTSLFNGITAQTANLSNLPQLMNSTLQMRAIPRWITSVTNIGDSITNLWLTLTDMRSAIAQLVNNNSNITCILLPPENLSLGPIGTSATDVFWDKSAIANIQPPTGYSVQVFTVADTGFTTPVFSQTKSEVEGTPNVMTIQSENIIPDDEYVVRIFSIYRCGQSTASSLTSILTTNPIP